MLPVPRKVPLKERLSAHLQAREWEGVPFYLDVFPMSLLLAGGCLPLVGGVGTQGTPDGQPGKGVQEKGGNQRGLLFLQTRPQPTGLPCNPASGVGPRQGARHRAGGLEAPHGTLLGESGARGVHEAVPLGGVGEQAWQDVAQQDQGRLLHVQTEDGVEQLHRTQRILLPRLFQQLLGGRGGGPRS